MPTDTLHAHVPRPDEAMMRRQLRVQLGAPVDQFLRARLPSRLVKYLDALLVEIQLGPMGWGLQERVAARTGRSKGRVSEALKAIRRIASANELEFLLEEDHSLGYEAVIEVRATAVVRDQTDRSGS